MLVGKEGLPQKILAPDNLSGNAPETSSQSVVKIDYHDSRWVLGTQLAEIGRTIYKQSPESFFYPPALANMEDTLHWLTDQPGYLHAFPNEFPLTLPERSKMEGDTITMPFLDFSTQIINAVRAHIPQAQEMLRRQHFPAQAADLEGVITTLQQISPLISEQPIKIELSPLLTVNNLRRIINVELIAQEKQTGE